MNAVCGRCIHIPAYVGCNATAYCMVYFITMLGLLQARVSIKRLGDFLQYKDLDENNVIQYQQSDETGNSSVYFITQYTNIIFIFIHHNNSSEK